MAVILMVSFFLGTAILDFFGITVPAIRLAGGIIIMYIGFGMLFPKETVAVEAVVADGSLKKDYAFTPLAMPMLSGPGSIAVVLEMSARVAGQSEIEKQVAGAVVVTIGILITVLICWIVLRAAHKIVKFLGTTRIDAVTKILGFLLISIGVQFAAGGVQGFING